MVPPTSMALALAQRSSSVLESSVGIVRPLHHVEGRLRRRSSACILRLAIGIHHRVPCAIAMVDELAFSGGGIPAIVDDQRTDSLSTVRVGTPEAWGWWDTFHGLSGRASLAASSGSEKPRIV